jgi:ATP-binding protein involved in chromosome partitioning
MALRAQADAGTPLVFADPDDPAAQAIRQTARGVIALTPVELPVMQAVGGPPEPPEVKPVGMSLPMA